MVEETRQIQGQEVREDIAKSSVLTAERVSIIKLKNIIKIAKQNQETAIIVRNQSTGKETAEYLKRNKKEIIQIPN